MQPSVVYCKYCGFWLRRVGNVKLPTDDEVKFSVALNFAREQISCPRCGMRKWIRKVACKV